MDICEPNESFFKKICIYVYIYICVGTVYGVDIEPVASCSIDGMEKNKWGRKKKKERKKEGTYRSVATYRIEIVHRLVDRRPTYT